MNVYEEDGRIVYRASALGGCLVALAAARQGYDQAAYSQHQLDIFARGERAEEWYAEIAKLTRRQETIELEVTNKIVVRGHIDGVNAGTTVDECKHVNDTDWRAWTPEWFDDHPLWRKYTWQISVYMLATGMMGRFVLINTAVDPYRFKIYTFEKPPHTLDEIRGRIFEAEATAREDELRCGLADYFCRYPSLHQHEITDEPELDALVGEYLRRKQIVDADAKALDGMKQQIRDLLGDRTKIHLMSGASVSFSEYQVKERVIPAGTQRRLTVRGPK